MMQEGTILSRCLSISAYQSINKCRTAKAKDRKIIRIREVLYSAVDLNVSKLKITGKKQPVLIFVVSVLKHSLMLVTRDLTSHAE